MAQGQMKLGVHFEDIEISGTTNANGICNISSQVGARTPLLCIKNSVGLITICNGSSYGFAPFAVVDNSNGSRMANTAFTATLRCIVLD